MGKRWLIRQIIMKPLRGLKELILCLILITCIFCLSIVIIDSSARRSIFKGHYELNHQQLDNSLGTSYHYVSHESNWMNSGSSSSSPSESSSSSSLTNNNNFNDRSLFWSFPSSLLSSSFQSVKPNNQINLSGKLNSGSIGAKIYQLLSKLNEEMKFRKTPNMTKIALVRSRNPNILKEMSIYKWALRKHGFLIETDNLKKNRINRRSRLRHKYSEDWILLICLDNNEVQTEEGGSCWSEHDDDDEDYSDTDDNNNDNNNVVVDNQGDNRRVGGKSFHHFNRQRKQVYQKMDGIPGLRNLLGTREAFCSTVREIHKVSTMRNPLSPLCFIFPQQYQTFLDVSDALGYSVSWSLKTPQGLQLINVLTDQGRDQLRDYNTKPGIIQRTLANPLKLFGSTITIRQFVAITSINPLRAYIHQGGLVYFTTSTNQDDHSTGHGKKSGEKTFQKVNGRLWSLDNFWDYMTINYGSQNVTYAQTSIKSHLTQFLLVTEALLLGQSSSFSGLSSSSTSSASSLSSSNFPTISSSSFLNDNKIFDSTVSLLAVDITLNSSLDSWILDVSMGTSFQRAYRDDGFTFTKLIRTIYDDYLSLITTTSNSVQPESSNNNNKNNNLTLVKEVTTTLVKVLGQGNVGIMGLNCHITHDVCLSSTDLTYLLNWKDEVTSNQGIHGFQCLYPTSESSSLGKLIEETSSKIVKSKLEKGGHSLMVHRTWDLHSFLMQMDIISTRISDQQNFIHHQPTTIDNQTNQQSESLSIPTTFNPMITKETCNQDESSLPYISSLEINPEINLIPTFSHKVSQYYANVTYDTLVITVHGSAAHCSSEVRLEGLFGPSRPTNFTLGLGVNKIVLTVVDVSQVEPMVINTYNVYINRLPLNQPDVQFEQTNKSYTVCYLKQDCDLLVYPRENCNLMKDSTISKSSKSWSNHLESRKLLPFCSSGSEPGKWSVPCLSCKSKNSCIWSSSIWEPDTCQYRQISSIQLSKCLAGRKILFIGDSTNRGLMHYVMEKLNGSLVDGDKTHELRIYNQLNSGSTLIGFNYYPKFWLPSFQRLTFDKTINELIKRAGPLSNSSETVLIFGGVQWLASQHINLLLQSLSSFNLNGIKVIMKTLGAGFHQKVEGIHSLSLEDQQKLAIHNQRLIQLAESHNIDVVDTFNMTISRYKDFYPGKCLCHFHQAVEIQEINQSGQPWTRYHIDGDVNAACGEILINLLCQEEKKTIRL